MKPISMMEEASGSKIAMIFFASFMWQHFSKFGENFYSNEMRSNRSNNDANCEIFHFDEKFCWSCFKLSILTSTWLCQLLSIDFLKNSERAFSLFLSGIFKIFISTQQWAAASDCVVWAGSNGRGPGRQAGSWACWADHDHDEQPIRTNWANKTLISKYIWYILCLD